MQVFIYNGDIYCLRCGNTIRALLPSPSNPDDEASYDSDDYPKGPYPDGGGEADCPQHCGCGEACLNAIKLNDGRKVGAFLENPLTTDGECYVIEADDGEIASIWREHYFV